MRRRRIGYVVLGIAVPIALIALWELGARQGWIDTRFYSSPSLTLERGLQLISTGELWDHIVVSSQRVLLGYSVGVVMGVLMGLVLAQSAILRAAFEPVLSMLYVVPKLAILPLLLLFFGLGDLPKILLIAISTFFIVVFATLGAALLTPKAYVEVAKSFGASRARTFWRVILPAGLPHIFSAMRLAAGISVLMMVAVEFTNANQGLGYLVWHSWNLLIPAEMYVGLVTISLLGVAFSSLVKALGTRITPWSRDTGIQGGGL